MCVCVFVVKLYMCSIYNAYNMQLNMRRAWQ